MYSLAPRFPDNEIQLDSSVEPTSYFIENNDEACKCKGPSFPFTSTSDRFAKLKKLKPQQSPSPAHYYPKYRKFRILGGKSLQYTTPRVCVVPKKQGPSALLYDPFSDYTSRSQTKKISEKFIKKIIWQQCCADIPVELNNETKELIRAATVSVPLPQYLVFPGEVSKSTLKYKGSHWGKYKSKRKGLEIENDLPGPATYNISPDPPSKKQAREREVKELQQPNCRPPPPEEKPGLREISSQDEVIRTTHYFDGTCDLVYKKISHNKNPDGIWAKSKRFTYKGNENPAPWSYSYGSIKCLRRIVKNVPFSSCSSRFQGQKNIVEASPASYNAVYGTIVNRLCSKLPKFKGTVRAPFSSTGPRLAPIISKGYIGEETSDEEDDDKPKQTYLAVMQVQPPYPKREVSTPQESVKVFPEEVCNDKVFQILGPSVKIIEEDREENAQVDMRDIYARYKGKISHRKPVGNEGFLSTDYNRSSWLVNKTPAHDVDWPEIDNVKLKGGALKMDVPVGKVDEPKEDESVYYDIHPLYGSSVYKSTYNSRLKNDEDDSPKMMNNSGNVKYILKCFMPKEILNA